MNSFFNLDVDIGHCYHIQDSDTTVVMHSYNSEVESSIMTIIESLGPAAATLGGGFFVCVLIGYAH